MTEAPVEFNVEELKQLGLSSGWLELATNVKSLPKVITTEII